MVLNHVQPKKYHRDNIYFFICRKAEEEEGREERKITLNQKMKIHTSSTISTRNDFLS